MTDYLTVAEAIASTGKKWPRNGYTFQDLRGGERFYSFSEVELATAGRAAAFQRVGVDKGDRVGLVLVEPEEFVLTFLAALRIGAVPVPVYPPLGLGNFDAYIDRVALLLKSCEATLLVTSPRLQHVLWTLVEKVPSLRRLVSARALSGDHGKPTYPSLGPDDLAFLQYTSGSTADPKGVMVTHRCLVANTQGNMGPGGLCMDAEKDIGVTWLPLYHDMGLIGFVVATVCWGVSVVFIPTLRFLRDPAIWMETIHRYRGTTSFGPCFAYGLISRKATPKQLSQWDLSCVKVFGCGGEPVNPVTIRKFTELFHDNTGMPRNAVRPGYGSAEVTLTISLTPMSEGMRVNRVDAERFAADGIPVSAVAGKPFLEHVACGVVIPGHEMRIFDENGGSLPEGTQGEICMRGPSVSPGYFRNQQATKEAFRDDWLRSGDLGYLLDGHVYVTGRIKDLIIYHGRNFHPQQIEWVAGEVRNVRKGNVVAFSVPGEDSEELIVVLETKETDRERIIADVRVAVQRETSLVPAEVVCLEPGEVPKTSSGKLQRGKVRQAYLEGTLGAKGVRLTGGHTNRLVLARQLARSFWARIKNSRRAQ